MIDITRYVLSEEETGQVKTVANGMPRESVRLLKCEVHPTLMLELEKSSDTTVIHRGIQSYIDLNYTDFRPSKDGKLYIYLANQ